VAKEMTDLEMKLSALSPEKRALFEATLKRQAVGPSPAALPAARPRQSHGVRPSRATPAPHTSGMDFSLMFFSGNGAETGTDKYDLLLQSAKFADEKGFRAIWVPERHFHSFGGLFPNPSVIAAALAMITQRLELRAGSVVLPLHDPIRIAEEWAVVDNLSGGRVALSLATGWHENDFVLAPDRYAERKEITFKAIGKIRKFWSGEACPVRGVRDQDVIISTFPRPVTKDLSIWITSAGSVDTFQRAGEAGAHLLTGLTGQNTEELAAKIAVYRNSLAQHGNDPASGRIALMLHSFIGDDIERVKETVRKPMHEYLRTNLTLHQELAKSRNHEVSKTSFAAQDETTLLEFAFERYFNGSSLFGTVESCVQ